MQAVLQIASSVTVPVVLADLSAGVVHWFEDSYVHREMPVLGKVLAKVADDNRLHHTRPRAFLAKNWWQSSWDIAALASLVVLAAWHFHALTYSVVIFAILVANANQIHKWTHQNPQEKGRLVYALQKLRILQTAREHSRHHTGNKDSHYCVITNFLNPILEKIHFWRSLEWLIARITGARPIRT